MKTIRQIFPITIWLREYPRSNLKWDILSGITLAFFVIPESMAYASLAGLPPQTGIYCYLFAGVLYAIFGTSRQLAIGPTSAISMVIGASIAWLSGGDPIKATLIASSTALMVAGLFLIAYLVKLNSLTNFISDTILTGFKAGAALAIASTQIPRLLGFDGEGDNFFERIWFLLSHLDKTNPIILIFGTIALILLILGHKFMPGKPLSLIVVVGSMLAVAFTPLGNLDIPYIGQLPQGFRFSEFPLFTLSESKDMLGLVLACFLLAYIESVSAAKTLAKKNGYEIDTRQELLALGAANFAAGIGGGFPSGGGLSQSTVNDQSGAKSPLALVITSMFLLVFLFFLSNVTRYLPEVILPVIVLHAVASLINVKEMKHLFRVSRYESLIMALSVLAVLVFGILNGLLISVILSILFLLRITSSPHIAILGRVSNTSRFTDMLRHPENSPVDGLLILRVEASIIYYNVPFVRDHVRTLVANHQGTLRMVIFDLSSSTYMDVSGARYFIDLEQELEKSNIELRVVEALGTVRDILRAEGLEMEIGHISRKVTLEEVVTKFVQPVTV